MAIDIKNILIMSLLVVGIFLGVLLVRQNQEYREKAAQNGIQEITICHTMGDNSWKELVITAETLKFHLDHGDILGKCPEGYLE